MLFFIILIIIFICSIVSINYLKDREIASFYECDGFGNCLAVPPNTPGAHREYEKCMKGCQKWYKCDLEKKQCDQVKMGTVDATTDLEKCTVNCCGPLEEYNHNQKKCMMRVDCSDSKYDIKDENSDIVYKTFSVEGSNNTECLQELPESIKRKQCYDIGYVWIDNTCLPMVDCSDSKYNISDEVSDFIYQTYHEIGSRKTRCVSDLPLREKMRQCKTDKNYQWINNHCYPTLNIIGFKLVPELSVGNYLTFQGDITQVHQSILDKVVSKVNTGFNCSVINWNKEKIYTGVTDEASIKENVLELKILRKETFISHPNLKYTFKLETDETFDVGLELVKTSFVIPEQTEELPWSNKTNDTYVLEFKGIVQPDYPKISASPQISYPKDPNLTNTDKLLIRDNIDDRGLWMLCLKDNCFNPNLKQKGGLFLISKVGIPPYKNKLANEISSVSIVLLYSYHTGYIGLKVIPIDGSTEYAYTEIGPFTSGRVNLQAYLAIHKVDGGVFLSKPNDLFSITIPSLINDEFCNSIPYNVEGETLSLSYSNGICNKPGIDDLKYNCLIQKNPADNEEILYYKDGQCVPMQRAGTIVPLEDTEYSCLANYAQYYDVVWSMGKYTDSDSLSDPRAAGCYDQKRTEIRHTLKCDKTPEISVDEFKDMYINTVNSEGKSPAHYWKTKDPRWSFERSVENMYPCARKVVDDTILKEVDCSPYFTQTMNDACCSPGTVWFWDKDKEHCYRITKGYGNDYTNNYRHERDMHGNYIRPPYRV